MQVSTSPLHYLYSLCLVSSAPAKTEYSTEGEGEAPVNCKINKDYILTLEFEWMPNILLAIFTAFTHSFRSLESIAYSMSFVSFSL